MLKFAYLWNACGFSIGMFIVTNWALSIFLPSISTYRFVVAIGNGLLFLIFILSGYNTFKSKIETNAHNKP